MKKTLLLEMIFVDVHEPHKIVNLLEERNCKVSVKALTPGDYVVGGIGLERKSLNDFYHSIIRKRFFEQLSRLKEAYSKSALIVEGDLNEITSFRNPNVFWGAFLSVVFDMEIPIIFTPSLEETADLLSTLDKRIEKKKEAYSLRYKPKMLSNDEWMLYIVQGLPHIGPKLAEKLLMKFGTVRNVFNANVMDLTSIPEIGEKKARKIIDVITSRYKGQKRLSGRI